MQLLPGHHITVKAGHKPRQERWWHISDHLWRQVPGTLEEQAARFYDLFRDACRIRLVSDVPVATALSARMAEREKEVA